MHKPWLTEFKTLLIYLVVALLVGFALGQFSWVLCIALVIFSGIQLWRMKTLGDWLDNTRKQPELSGGWGEIAYNVFRIGERARRRKKRLSRMLRQFQETTSAIPDGAVVIDSHHQVQWFNRAGKHILGLKSGDVGSSIGNYLRHPRFTEMLSSDQIQLPFEMPSPQDENKILEIRLVQYSGDLRLLLARDNTQVHNLMKMRREFVANVSHELKTPLTVIMGYLELLEDIDDLSPETEEALGKLQSQSIRMRAVVDDLLTLSRLDTAPSPGRDASLAVNVPVMLKSLVETVKDYDEGNHDIILEMEVDLHLVGLENELHSVFSNLISNAIKYTPQGGQVFIRWCVGNASSAYFEVEDTGAGIAADHIGRLTERFYRVDVGRSREKGGTGLGLAIVKQILRRHDGSLEIDSEVGKGSTFRCYFPKMRIAKNIAAAS